MPLDLHLKLLNLEILYFWHENDTKDIYIPIFDVLIITNVHFYKKFLNESNQPALYHIHYTPKIFLIGNCDKNLHHMHIKHKFHSSLFKFDRICAWEVYFITW